MTTEILFKFAKKGINLSPEAYSLINGLEDPLDFSSSLIVRLKSQEFSKNDLISLNSNVVEEFIKTLGLKVPNLTDEEESLPKSQKTFVNSEAVETSKTNNKDKNENDSSDSTISHEIKSDNLVSSSSSVVDGDSSSSSIVSSESISSSSAGSASTSSVSSTISNDSSVVDVSNNIDSTVKTVETHHIIEESSSKRFVPEECKRNLTPCDAEYDFEIIQDTSNKSYTCGDIGNLITYFKNRYDKISAILSKRPELKAFQKINDLEEKTTDLNLIVMVREIKNTKNGHRIIEFEDDTGEITVLFHKDNTELFKQSEKLVKDEIIGLIAEKKGDLAIANRIIQPGVPRIATKTMDFSVVFTSDIHIGSLTFLEDAFVRFTDWLNGDYGTEEQKKIGKDVKYMIVCGDIVDGIGIYPNQDKELAIKDITEQYDEAARLLGNIRSDIKIIIAPGNHDASRVAEPQPAIPEKYAKSLYELNNVEFVSNPAIVNLEGWETLIYHGRGFDDIAITVNGFSHEENDLIMEELLNKRHLAPIYGERTPLASELEDYLVVDNIPDIFHTGHVHINTYKNYKGVHMINSGTFQTQTEFQKVHNILPTCAEVPVLYRGTYKLLKFI